MSTCHRLHLRTRPTPSPGAVIDGLQERACKLSAARAPVARGRWPLVPWHPRPVERASGKRFALVSALPRCSRGQEVVAGLGTLPARFGLVVWIGVLEVRGWFPIQLQHDPGVQTPTLSRPARPSVRLATCVWRTAACFSHATREHFLIRMR